MRDSFFEKYKTSEVTNTRRVINTPSAFTREHFFYIQEAGYLKSLKPHMSRRSRSEERRVGKECRSRWSPYH